MNKSNISEGVKFRDFLSGLKIDKSDIESAGFNPYYKSVENSLGRRVTIEGKKLISFGSNDYLGIANSDELKQAAREALDKYGISMCGTPIVVGQTDLHKTLEKRIAEFLKKEEVMLFPSGYQANIGIFWSLTTDKDIIITDRFVHSSLLNGISLSKAKKRFFLHNDHKNLENILKDSQDYRMRFIVIEGVYSTEGDTAPLDKITGLSEKYNAFLILDDAHGIGVLGKHGKGTAELFDVLENVNLITGSLGKALGCFGGFIATNSEIADYLKYSMAPLIYSTALPPVVAAASLASINLVEDADLRRQHLYRNKERMYNALKQMGYKLTPSSTPLFSILLGTNAKTFKLTKSLFEKGVYVTPFATPSVPKGHSLVRLIPHANLTQEDISEAIHVFDEVKKK